MAAESCDLCIIGAGYAGINALNAACKYLHQGAKVIVVDKRTRWGGQWVDQYDFVRLHQPYEQFTAGERSWSLKAPKTHLASKTEILAHFEDIAAKAVAESGVQLVTLFGYQHAEHQVTQWPDKIDHVQVLVEPTSTALGPLPSIKIRASRLIKAIGFDLPIKKPLTLESAQVHSLAPADVLSPHWNAMMNYSGHYQAPIWVMGSGKTAYDCLLNLDKVISNSRERLHCVSGRGTLFMNRDIMFPDSWWLTHSPFASTGLDHMFDALILYDGNNEQEVYSQMQNRGFFHSAVPDPQNFQLGICSQKEIATVRAVLTPAESKIIKGHLMDVVSSDTGPQLKIKMLDGSVRLVSIPSGTFIVNATDNRAFGANDFEPILSEDGLVLSPQKACGFSGPSANHLTHLFYLNQLKPIWKLLPRAHFDYFGGKAKMGLHALFGVVINDAMVRWHLPQSVALANKQSPITWFPLHVRLLKTLRGAWYIENLIRKSRRISPYTYADDNTNVEDNFSQFMQRAFEEGKSISLHSKL